MHSGALPGAGGGSIKLLADATGVYAFDGAILKSEDKGETWRLLAAFLEATYSIAVARSTIYRLTSSQGLYNLQRSDDGGSTWKLLSDQARHEPRILAVDPHRPNVVYLQTVREGLLRSIDSGQSWSAFNDGLPTLLLNGVAIDPRSGDVFALTIREGIVKRPVEARRRAIAH